MSAERPLEGLDWDECQAMWWGLGRILDLYETGSPGWTTIVEALRLVEAELRLMGATDAHFDRPVTEKEEA